MPCSSRVELELQGSFQALLPPGDTLLESNTVRKIGFTGSTAVGKQLMAGAADTVKRVSLELGGNAPFIVFDDADVETAAAGVVASAFRNAGQTCICANRVFVQVEACSSFQEEACYDVSSAGFVSMLPQSQGKIVTREMAADVGIRLSYCARSRNGLWRAWLGTFALFPQTGWHDAVAKACGCPCRLVPSEGVISMQSSGENQHSCIAGNLSKFFVVCRRESMMHSQKQSQRKSGSSS